MRRKEIPKQASTPKTKKEVIIDLFHLAERTHTLQGEPLGRRFEPAHAVEVRRDSDRAPHIAPYGDWR